MAKAQQHIRKTTCEEAEKWFNDLIDGYLKGKTRTELEYHIDHCKHCFGRVEFEKKLKERIRTAKVDRNTASLRKKIVRLLDEV